jgi:hypothetical protein
MAEITRYLLEDRDGHYLDDFEETGDYNAADAEASRRKARLIEVTYTWDDSCMVEDYTVPPIRFRDEGIDDDTDIQYVTVLDDDDNELASDIPLHEAQKEYPGAGMEES